MLNNEFRFILYLFSFFISFVSAGQNKIDMMRSEFFQELAFFGILSAC